VYVPPMPAGRSHGSSSVTGVSQNQALVSRRTIFWAVMLVLLLLAAGAALMWRGYAYYSLDLVSRLDSPDNQLLAPGKPVGHAYGVIGTALIMTNLLYIVRRKWARLPIGSMRAWLNLHSTTGLVGGVLVVFHSAFQTRSPIATTTMFALFIVLITGIVGRFLSFMTPRPDTARFRSHLKLFDEVGPGMGEVVRARLDKMMPTRPRRASILSLLLTVPTWIREARARRQLVLDTAVEFELAHNTEVKLLGARVDEAAEMAAAEVRATAAEWLLKSWRGVHRFAALVLVVLVMIHIAVAWYLGYRWIFSTE
jgi:hypothetical protein